MLPDLKSRVRCGTSSGIFYHTRGGGVNQKKKKYCQKVSEECREGVTVYQVDNRDDYIL